MSDEYPSDAAAGGPPLKAAETQRGPQDTG